VARSFDPNAPAWRRVCKGLNVDGKCESASCKAFGQTVIHCVGYEQFNLLKDASAKCPMCHARVKPFTCRFYDCAWKFEGVKLSNGNSIASPWKDASGHQEHRFEANEKTGCVDWTSLLIVAKPRIDANAAKLLLSRDQLNRAGVNLSDTCTICWSKFGLGALFTAPTSHDSLPSCPACRKAV
jgi:hypothetical protein